MVFLQRPPFKSARRRDEFSPFYFARVFSVNIIVRKEMMNITDANIPIYSYRFTDLKKREWRDGVN